MTKKSIALIFVITILSLSCSLSKVIPNGESLFASSTPSKTATVTPFPTPTPTPTPVPAVRIEQADNYLFEGDPDRASQEFQNALNLASDNETHAAALFGLGRAVFLSRKYDSAIETFKRVVNEFPDSPSAPLAQFLLGQCFMIKEQYSEAAGAFAEYLHLRPGFLDAYVQELYGDALSGSNEHEKAIAAYQAAIDAPKLGDSTGLEIKIGQQYAAMGDHTNAIRKFTAIYEATSNDYTKAQANLLAGQSYLAMGIPEQAYARFQDSVNNFPRAYDSYSGLVQLVNDGIQVDDLNRGLVDYYVGQYGVAVDAFNRYLQHNPKHDGTVYHYKALALRANGFYEDAIKEWDALITENPGDRFYSAAFDEKAYTQWVYLNQFPQAAKTLLDFVKQNPTAEESPQFLFDAGRIYERGNLLNDAAKTWERLINEYPSASVSPRGLFLAGITYYRMGDYKQAQIVFQRDLVLSSSPADQAPAYFWIGKTEKANNDPTGAKSAWKEAAQRDPGSYYSGRAGELLAGLQPFTSSGRYHLDYNLQDERKLADMWMHNTFNLKPEVDLNDPGSLSQDGRYQRGNAFWELGLYSQAAVEFDALRQDLQQDAPNSYRLLDKLVKLGFYQSAILTSRQILNLANLDDVSTFTAPNYFNHIRFGTYFQDLILESARRENIDPLFLFAVTRQESMFQGYAMSSAGARGLMQIMPSTGQEIVTQFGWPSDYTDQDLYLPKVSITLGAHYLARQRDAFKGDLFASLAAYNGGPGNALIWQSLSANDPDLFVEVVRASETRTYIVQIAEFMQIYKRLYENNLLP